MVLCVCLFFFFSSVACFFFHISSFVVEVQLLSCVRLFAIPWIVAHQAYCPSLSPRVCSNSCLLSQWCYPTISSSVTLFSSSLQPFPASVSFPIGQPNYWSFSVSISPSNEYSLLISFTLYWFDHFSVQGTLKSLLQHHSSKASVLQCSASFIIQLSLSYMTTGKP